MAFRAGEVIKNIAAETITPQLKALGYRKSALTWRKPVGELVRVVNVQTNSFPHFNEAKFTVNLGIFHPLLHEARQGGLPKKNIAEHNCDLRVRIGQLMHKNDYWWKVDPETDLEEIREHFAANFTEHAVPWIEQFHELPDIYKYCVSKRQYFLAGMAAYVLERPDTADWIAKALRHAPHDNFTRFVEVWARDHGIATQQE